MINVKPSTLGQMLISSVRYALGRQTYIVADTCSWVRRFWKYIDPKDQTCILRDIAKAPNRGGPCDDEEWRGLVDWIARQEAPDVRHG